MFERGPRHMIADCMSDGHYQCVECIHFSEEGEALKSSEQGEL